MLNNHHCFFECRSRVILSESTSKTNALPAVTVTQIADLNPSSASVEAASGTAPAATAAILV